MTDDSQDRPIMPEGIPACVLRRTSERAADGTYAWQDGRGASYMLVTPGRYAQILGLEASHRLQVGLFPAVAAFILAFAGGWVVAWLIFAELR